MNRLEHLLAGEVERRGYIICRERDRKRRMDDTETMREAERDLDDFWAKFDSKYRYKVGKTINEIVEGFLFRKS